MSNFKLIALASILTVASACGGKKNDPPKNDPPKEGSAMAGTGSAMAGTGSADPGPGSANAGSAMAGSGSDAGSGSAMAAGSGSDAAPAADADFITVLAAHKEKKPDDPVQVQFKKYAVTKATFDPAKIEGGTATIEIDTTSLSSGKTGRDEHLAKADYLDVPKFAKIVIDVSDVKKKEGKTYTAKAKVQALGNTKTYPVTFEVVDAKDDWIKIKGEHKFSRLDFKVGKDPKDAKESVAAELTIKMQLTLKKT